MIDIKQYEDSSDDGIDDAVVLNSTLECPICHKFVANNELGDHVLSHDFDGDGDGSSDCDSVVVPYSF